MSTPITKGVHHVGLTVSNLEESAAFFISNLGWTEVRRNEEYPAIFVSDGSTMLTLWATKDEPVTPFNRRGNVGLHHLALQVESEATLNQVYEQLVRSGVRIEFAPELVRQGPAKHTICYEPSGIRLEFIWSGT